MSRKPVRPDDSESTDARPFYRNPWFWAGVIGIAAVTCVRPFMVRVPPPPPPGSPVAVFAATDPAGAAVDLASLAGETWVAVQVPCRGVDDTAWGHLRQLAERSVGLHEPLLLVATCAEAGVSGEERRRLLGRLGVPAGSWRLLSRDDADSHWLEERWRGADDGWGPLIIVDGLHRRRGRYDLTELGVDEVFHRTQHVRMAAAMEGASSTN